MALHRKGQVTELQLYPWMLLTVSSANSDYLEGNRWTAVGSGSGILQYRVANFDVGGGAALNSKYDKESLVLSKVIFQKARNMGNNNKPLYTS